MKYNNIVIVFATIILTTFVLVQCVFAQQKVQTLLDTNFTEEEFEELLENAEGAVTRSTYLSNLSITPAIPASLIISLSLLLNSDYVCIADDGVEIACFDSKALYYYFLRIKIKNGEIK